MKTILILSTALVLICTVIFVHLGETTEWASQQTIQDYVDGKASVTVECDLPSN